MSVHNLVVYRVKHKFISGKDRQANPVFILTCFVSGDGELVAGFALADQVLGKHADIVGGGRVQVDDGGLVELR